MNDRIQARKIVFRGIAHVALDQGQARMRSQPVAEPLDVESGDFVPALEELRHQNGPFIAAAPRNKYLHAEPHP